VTKKAISPYERFVDARMMRSIKKAQPKLYRSYTRAMWEAASDALLQVKSGQPLDEEIAVWLQHTIEMALSNRKSEDFDALRAAGGIRDTRDISKAKQVAALYKQAVAANAVNDLHVIDTLQALFGCHKQEIYKWIRNAPENLWDKFRPKDSLQVRIKSLHTNMKWAEGVLMTHSKTTKALRKRRK
jgi:hypothetical protein